MIQNVILLSIYALMASFSCLLWQKLIIARIKQGKEILQQRKKLSVSLGLIDVASLFFVWLIGQILAAKLILDLKESDGDSITSKQLAVLALVQLATTIAGLLILRIRYGSELTFGLSLAKWKRDLGVAAAAFLIAIPPILVLQFLLTRLIPYQHQTLDALKLNPGFWPVSMAWFAAVLVAPVCEEIFFRGVLQRWLHAVFPLGKNSLEQTISGFVSSVDPKGRSLDSDDGNPSENISSTIARLSENPYSPPRFENDRDVRPNCREDQGLNLMAIFFSSLAFAAVHIGQGAAPIPLFFLGLTLGYLFFKTNSLIPCILLHMGLNGFSMFWFTLSLLFESKTIG